MTVYDRGGDWRQNGGIAEKISCARWGRKIRFDHKGSVKTYTINKQNAPLSYCFLSVG